MFLEKMKRPDLSGRLFHRPVVWAAQPREIQIILFAVRQEPAPLEEPQSLPHSLRSGQALSKAKGPERGLCANFSL